jgi:hypothetical protein
MRQFASATLTVISIITGKTSSAVRSAMSLLPALVLALVDHKTFFTFMKTLHAFIFMYDIIMKRIEFNSARVP